MTDLHGKTALFYAVQQNNNESVVRSVICAGADVNKADLHGKTALFYAVQQSNNESVVRTLINAGADVNKTNEYGQTALFYAIQQSNNESVVRTLIDAGADVNMTKNDGKTALLYAVKKSNNERMVRALIDVGADVNITDKYGQTSLFYAVQQSNNESDIDTVLIPWTSVSKKHEDKLAKVARRQECHVVGQFWLHNDYIGCGSFGHVFAGINDKDGREVAIKRIEKLKMQRPEDRREITNLTALADCEQFLRYLQFFDDDDGKFSYVVLELMEGNLDDYLSGPTHDTTKGTQLCEDVIKGMAYLHEKKILHRDLKPGNILFKVHPRLCLKIADFGLSLRMDLEATTVYGTNAGTRCWIAPEVLKSKMDHCKSTDMFSCGLLLHYILSVKKHPFSPAVFAGKGEYQIAHETESNIMKGEMEGWDKSLSPEATHLVRSILESDVKARPTAAQALDHPLFWSKNKKIDFLTAVGNQSVFESPRARRSTCVSAIEADLETTFRTIVRKGAWNDPGYVHMPVIFAEMRKKRTYDVHSAVELVRFIRNAYAHVSEHTRPTAIRKLLLEDFVVLEYFPDLVMEVYKLVTAYGWDQTKEEVKYSMNK